MNQLKKIETDFQNFLLNRDEHILPEISEGIQSGRLDIYYDGYRLRLIECLSQDFEKLVILMGETAFEEAALDYIQHHPSTFRSIRHFGEHFPSFLASNMPYQTSPILAELAQFEWLLGSTMDAADFEPMSLESLKQTPVDNWPSLHFKLQPALFFMQSLYDAPKWWNELTPDQTNVPPFESIHQNPQYWVIWRKGLMAHYASISEEEHALLMAIQVNADFAHICELLSHRHEAERVPLIAVTYLQKWIQSQYLWREP